MNNKTKLIKEKHNSGEVHLYYQDDKLIKKIDYTRSPPWLYTYKDNTVRLTVLEPKSHKKLWLGIIGTLLILSSLYGIYKMNKHKASKINNISIQKTIE